VRSLYETLTQWVDRHYRDRMSENDLTSSKNASISTSTTQFLPLTTNAFAENKRHHHRQQCKRS
ncbi:hypothetical protein BUE60_29120, partial [Pseudomonas syringae pv. actinidiae]